MSLLLKSHKRLKTEVELCSRRREVVADSSDLEVEAGSCPVVVELSKRSEGTARNCCNTVEDEDSLDW